MKVAVCYYGNVGWKFGKNNTKEELHPSECFASIKNHILDVKGNEVDIFVHTWSENFKTEIINIMAPKAILVEPPKKFSDRKIKKQRIEHFADFKNLIIRLVKRRKSGNNDMENTLYRLYSRWYSTLKVVELKCHYEKQMNIKYDFVMLLRFDIEFFKDIDFGLYDINKFYAPDPSNLLIKRHNYLVSLNKDDYIYQNMGNIELPLIFKFKNKFRLRSSIFWTQPTVKSSFLSLFGIVRYSISDTWFFAGNEIMDNFAQLYYFLDSYPPCPHQAAFKHIRKYLKSNDFEFPFKQFDDFEIYRYSKKFGSQLPNWNL